MSALLGIHNLSKSFGTQNLFDNLSLTFHEGDRVGLIGPNGAGKTSLLKIIIDLEQSDSGHITKKQGLRIGYAEQVPEFTSLSLEDVLLENAQGDDEIANRTRAQTLLSKAQFTDFSQNASTLSGGWKKRLDISRALMAEPDLLLLDEPTNHLDLEGILWLEQFLNRERISFVVISHDRYFLENVTNKIIEINKCYPQGLFISDGNISNFMEHKEAFLQAQEQQQKGLASVVRDEAEWLKRSPKARTTKSQSRVKQAYKLMEDLSEVQKRNKVTRVDVAFAATERETRKLLTAHNLAKTLGEKQLFKDVNLTLSPGSRVGIVGKNGTGKTTLLKVLADIIPHDQGTVKYAENLRLVYFDQHREQVPLNTTLKEALSPGGDFVHYHGQSIHVNGWAQKFLFPKERLEMPVGLLSGGERARILIAKLMLKPADILFLDEPTNDLDIPTLEVIENSLQEFPGAIVLITHDRCMMDRVCTQILGLGEGNEQDIFADYSQWEIACIPSKEIKKNEPKTAKPQNRPSNQLTYKEKRELEAMEENILIVEGEIELLSKQIETSEGTETADLYHKLAATQNKLDALFERWDELSKKK